MFLEQSMPPQSHDAFLHLLQRTVTIDKHWLNKSGYRKKICAFRNGVRDKHWPGMCTRPSEPRQRRDPCLRDRDENEMRRCSFQDLTAPETLESLGRFNVSPRRFPWSMVKHIDNEKNYTDQLTRTMVSAFYLWYCGFLHFILTIITK